MNLCYIEQSFKYLNLLKEFIKDNITLKAIKSVEELKTEDLFVIDKNHSDYEQLIKNSSNILILDDIFYKFYEHSVDIYMENYDYYYLKNSLKKAKQSDNEAIVVGSSYALFGFEESMLDIKCVNLALASQDFYYACLIGKNVIGKNNNIKKIFIGTGYYTFYNDLSLTEGYELTRITNVYYPIFGDVHNCKELPQSETTPMWEDDIFDIEKIVNSFCKNFYEVSNNQYFTPKRSRFNSKVELRPTENLSWFELDDDFQEICAYERAISHNKSIRYLASYKENLNILNSFVSFCNERNVEIYMIAFPSTRFYKKYLLKEFKDSYISALKSINGDIKFIDLNEIDIFTDEDFVDMDHLDVSGAIKVSEYINNLKIKNKR